MTKMSDYYRFRPLILAAAKVAGIIPKRLLLSVYVLIQPFPGKAFVLLRYLILRNICKSVGDNVFVANCVEIRYPELLEIGSNVSFQKGCYIDAIGGVVVGNDVSVAHYSSLVSFDHGWGDESLPIRKNPFILQQISIADDVWIGAGVRILSGARIGSRCIVAAGAVVTKGTECKGCSLIAGVPAKVKASLTSDKRVGCTQ